MLCSGSQVVLVAILNTIDKMSSGYYGIINLLIQMLVNLYRGIGLAIISLVGKTTRHKRP